MTRISISFVYLCSFSVVTGCTEGIGEEFARQLGRRGCNVALVARNEAKMRRIAQEIGKVQVPLTTRIMVYNGHLITATLRDSRLKEIF